MGPERLSDLPKATQLVPDAVFSVTAPQSESKCIFTPSVSTWAWGFIVSLPASERAALGLEKVDGGRCLVEVTFIEFRHLQASTKLQLLPATPSQA